MARNKSFDEHLSEELRNPKSAQTFLLTLMEGDEGLPLEKALKQTILAMGVKEFCERSKISMPSVVQFLKGKRKPKPETLDLYLKPLGLKAKLAAIKLSKVS